MEYDPSSEPQADLNERTRSEFLKRTDSLAGYAIYSANESYLLFLYFKINA